MLRENVSIRLTQSRGACLGLSMAKIQRQQKVASLI
jgi:hypothetical protein